MARVPLIDAETLKFVRGKHEGEGIAEVAKADIEFLLWIVYDSQVSKDDMDVIENWLWENPDYCDLVEL